MCIAAGKEMRRRTQYKLGKGVRRTDLDGIGYQNGGWQSVGWATKTVHVRDEE